MRNHLLSLAFVIYGCLALAAQEENASKINFSLQGSLELDHISYFKKEEEKINTRNEATFTLKSILEFDEAASFEMEVESREDIQDDFRRRLFYVRTAFFHFVDRRLDVKIGKQLVNWGAADIYSPINGINPIDYTDFLDRSDNQLGVWMARSKRFHTNRFATEVLISPFSPAIAAPNPNSRWVVGLPSAMPHPTDRNLLLPIDYQYQNLQPNFSDIGMMVGLRNSLTLGKWDVAHSFLVNHNSAPNFEIDLSQLRPDKALFNLTPIYQNQYMLGVDFATILKNTGFRGEVAWKGLSGTSENQGLETNYLEYTLGFDRTFSRLLFNKNVSVFGQWVHQIVFKDERIGDNNIRFFLRKAIILRTELALSYFSSFNIQALHTLDNKNWYLQPSLRYRFKDGFTLMAQTDILFGKSDGFLGQFVGNDRVQVRLVYDF